MPHSPCIKYISTQIKNFVYQYSLQSLYSCQIIVNILFALEFEHASKTIMFDFIAPTQFLLENPPIEHSHDCKKCLVKFSTVGELRRHRRYKHQDEKRHKCDQCEYKCVEFDKLIRHKRMHAGIKPFKCSQCQYESYDKSKVRHFFWKIELSNDHHFQNFPRSRGIL